MKAGYRVGAGGVVHAPAAERFEMLMRSRDGRDLRAVSSNFDGLLNLREQLIALGYGLVRLERQTT